MTGRHHLPTQLAIGIVIQVLSTLAHEVIGHGGACLLVGGTPLEVSGSYFVDDDTGLPRAAIWTISAGGSAVNLLLGLGFLALLKLRPPVSGNAYYLVWYGALANLASATGYVMFGAAFAFGDYGNILATLDEPLAARIVLAVLGTALYVGLLFVMARHADPLLGNAEDRRRRLLPLVLLPAIGATIILATGALLSTYPITALTSAIGHVFPAIGTWGMCQWFIHDSQTEPARPIVKSALAPIALVVIAAFSIAVIGPGLPR